MPRLQAIRPEDATGKAKKLLEGVRAKYGMTPNLLATMANSPALLEAYLGFSGALSRGRLSARLREQIALAVSEVNQCGYCLAAHSAVGKMAGLSEEQVQDSRRGTAADTKVEAALRFARAVVQKDGWVSDGDLARLRAAGYGDGEIAEIVGNVLQTIFTNYFNHVAGTEVDFPKVEALATT